MHLDTWFLNYYVFSLFHHLLLTNVVCIHLTGFDGICNGLLILVRTLLLERLYLTCNVLQTSYLVSNPKEPFTRFVKHAIFIGIVDFLVEEHCGIGLLLHAHG